VKAKAEASVASWPSMPTTPNTARKVPKAGAPSRRQPVEGVALQVVADLVAEDGGELGLVVGAQQEAAPDLHHAVGRHAGIEERRAQRIDADVGAMRAGKLAGDALQVLAQGGVANQEGAAAQPALLAIHERPQAAFVARELGAQEPRRRGPGSRRGGLRPHGARCQRRTVSAGRGEQPSPFHRTTGTRSGGRPSTRMRRRPRAGRRLPGAAG
jgi:hypothetical protein